MRHIPNIPGNIWGIGTHFTAAPNGCTANWSRCNMSSYTPNIPRDIWDMPHVILQIYYKYSPEDIYSGGIFGIFTSAV